MPTPAGRLLLLVCALMLAACADDPSDDGADGASGERVRDFTVTRGPNDIIVGEGDVETLQDALDTAQPGQRIVLPSGEHNSKAETRRPGPVTIAGEPGAVLTGDGEDNGLRIVHDQYTLQGVEMRDVGEGLRIEGAKDVLIRGVEVHHVENECIRVRFASDATLEDVTVHHCGLEGNGEGVYVGLAPEQQDKFDGKEDPSFARITRLLAYETSEGVDVKENARAVVLDSEITASWDEKSGAIDFRSDGNEAHGNVLHGNDGAGIRVGGDRRGALDDAECDGSDCWGEGNILRDNRAFDNDGAGYRFMWAPQDVDCSNLGDNNKDGLFAYGERVDWRVPCA